MKIITREQWGAQYRDGFGSRAVGSLEKWLHHSVTTHLSEDATFLQEVRQMQIIERIGQQRFSGGISYTFLAFPSGRLYEGHSVGRIGAHTAGHNTAGASLCLVGNYQDTAPSKAQQDAAVWLLKHGVDQGWWNDPAFTGGHREVRSTSCPGNRAFDMIPELNARGRAPGVVVIPAAVVKPRTPKPSPATDPRQSNKNRPNGSTEFPSDYANLFEDGKFQALSVGAFQILMEAIKVGRRHNQRWDGDFGKLTVLDAMEWLQANGYYKTTRHARGGIGRGAQLRVDGIPGYWFWYELQRFLKAKGLYNRALDGDPGFYTYRAFQRYLNTQNGS